MILMNLSRCATSFTFHIKNSIYLKKRILNHYTHFVLSLSGNPGTVIDSLPVCEKKVYK